MRRSHRAQGDRPPRPHATRIWSRIRRRATPRRRCKQSGSRPESRRRRPKHSSWRDRTGAANRGGGPVLSSAAAPRPVALATAWQAQPRERIRRLQRQRTRANVPKCVVAAPYAPVNTVTRSPRLRSRLPRRLPRSHTHAHRDRDRTAPADPRHWKPHRPRRSAERSPQPALRPLPQGGANTHSRAPS
jgi:hypothetical protein